MSYERSGCDLGYSKVHFVIVEIISHQYWIRFEQSSMTQRLVYTMVYGLGAMKPYGDAQSDKTARLYLYLYL